MHFSDRLTLDGAMRRTSDGYAVLSAKVARGGNVQMYLGAEVGVADKAVVRVYRPADQVFSRDAIKSYAGVPVTVGHPKAGVTADTWKDLAVGEVGDEVLRDGEFVRVPMMLRDAKAIEKVEAGTRELSMGYEAEITMHDGVSPSGERFDAIMSGFKMNHVAIVDQARGGTELRIGDGADEAGNRKWGASPIHDQKPNKEPPMADLTTVVVGDSAVQIAASDAAKFETFKATTKQALADAEAKLATALAVKDEEIGKLKADLKTAQDALPKPGQLDKLVADRAALVAIVNAIDSAIVVDGKSDADLRRAAVAAKHGDDFVKDEPDAAIVGMFKALAKDAKVAPRDPVRDTITGGIKTVDHRAAVTAHAAYVSGLTDAWQNPNKGAN